MEKSYWLGGTGSPDWRCLSQMVSCASEGAPLVVLDSPFEPVPAGVSALSWANSYDLGPDNFIVSCELPEFAFKKMKVRGTYISNLKKKLTLIFLL